MARLQASVAAKSMGERVRFLGGLDDVRPVYAAADVVVMPSRWEGMPYMMLEAMAMGKPLVASSVCGLDDIIEPEETGLLVPPNDPELLAAAVVRVLRDNKLRKGLGKAAHEAVQRWSLKRQTMALFDLYEGLADRVRDRRGRR